MSEDGDDESRASRLHNRRRRSRGRAQQQEPEADEADKTDKTEETDKSSKTSKPDKPSKPDKSEDGSGTQSVKDEQIGTFMYLPESVVDELGYQYKIRSAEVERATGSAMEKNRHWYPLVISLGLEQIEEMSTEEIAAHLSSLDTN